MPIFSSISRALHDVFLNKFFLGGGNASNRKRETHCLFKSLKHEGVSSFHLFFGPFFCKNFHPPVLLDVFFSSKFSGKRWSNCKMVKRYVYPRNIRSSESTNLYVLSAVVVGFRWLLVSHLLVEHDLNWLYVLYCFVFTEVQSKQWCHLFVDKVSYISFGTFFVHMAIYICWDAPPTVVAFTECL